VDHQQDPQGRTHAEEEEKPLFVRRVVGIVADRRVVVVERRLGLVERDPVLVEVCRRFPRIPLKPDRGQTGRYILRMYVASPIRAA
jgi:hypothetical protein